MTIAEGAHIVLADCMGAREGERVLIVTDTETREVGEALFAEAQHLKLAPVLMISEPTEVSGAEPADSVGEAMKQVDICLCPTLRSLTHTAARKAASEAGVRVATMPGITPRMLTEGAITADYRKVADRSNRLAQMLDGANTARIEKDGEVLTMSLVGRRGISSHGLYHEKGQSGNLPTGEAFIAPVEGTAQGTTIIDGSLAGIGTIDGKLHVRVEGGKAVELEGAAADELKAVLDPKPLGRTVAELGIGTNPKAKLWGSALEDEKVYGTAHIAFGSNATFGGNTSAGVHIDGIILSPTVYIDDQLVLKDGELRF